MKKILDYIEDICILGGLVVIIVTTFLLSIIAGLYATGVILLALGVYFTRHPPKRR